MSEQKKSFPGYMPPDITHAQMGDCASREDKLIHYLKKLCHELKRMNDLSQWELYIRFVESAQEHGGAFDCNSAAMLRVLEPPKRKRKRKKKELDLLDLM